MTRERLITVREGVSKEEAKQLLHKHRIEKLLVVDDDLSLHRADHGQGYREGRALSQRRQGRAGPPARRVPPSAVGV
jgi:CBS domain-containing protein